jgi:hypothetical protein
LNGAKYRNLNANGCDNEFHYYVHCTFCWKMTLMSIVVLFNWKEKFALSRKATLSRQRRSNDRMRERRKRHAQAQTALKKSSKALKNRELNSITVSLHTRTQSHLSPCHCLCCRTKTKDREKLNFPALFPVYCFHGLYCGGIKDAKMLGYSNKISAFVFVICNLFVRSGRLKQKKFLFISL